MADLPPSAFWAFEELPNGRIVEIERGSGLLYEADLRNERYDLDVEKWARQWYWNAQQAACISFHRDPTKINEAYSDDDLCGIPANGDGYQQHIALENAIARLENMITDAQNIGLLPANFFCPGQYFEWASRMGIDFPRDVRDEVQKFQREVSYLDQDADSSQDRTARDLVDPSKLKARGGEGKLDHSLQKIILSLLLKYIGGYDRTANDGMNAAKAKLQKADCGQLSNSVASILEELEETGKGSKFRIGVRTIKDHLFGAVDLLK